MKSRGLWKIGLGACLLAGLGACSDDSMTFDRGVGGDASVDLRADRGGSLRDGPIGADHGRDAREDQRVFDTRVDQPQGGPDRGVPDVRVADVRVSDLGRPDHRSPDAPKVVLLSNGVCSSTTMGPMASGAGEDGHLAASRLTPKHYPFTVTQVRYALLPGSSLKCHTGMAHRVDIYAAGGVAPAAFPIVLRSISVNAQANGSTIRVITLDVTPPLVLTQGQQLFVAVEMRIDANSNRTCLRSCFPPSGALPGRDYWSNAASAPYPWKSLKDSGIPAVYSTQALGY